LGLRIFARKCATLFALGAAASCGNVQALAPNPSKSTWGTPIVTVGSKNYFGFTELKVAGSDPVHLVGAAVQGVPDGLKIAGIYAVSIQETDGTTNSKHYIADLSEDDIRRFYPKLHLHPITDAVVKPGPLDWYLVVVAVPTRTGRYMTTGMRVDYQVGSDTGSQTFIGWQLDVRCGIPPSPSPSPT
jgi:hypothetical protein